jgi:hypothetical protein
MKNSFKIDKKLVYKTVQKKAEEKNKNIKPNDFNEKYVYYIGKDGTTLLFKNAFIEDSGSYILIFTEHYGYHVMHKDETISCTQIFGKSIEAELDIRI